MTEISKSKKPGVIVVDDEEDLADILSETLSMEDYPVRTFYSPKEALSEISDIEFSVVISDSRMPGLTGIEFLKELKSMKLPKFQFYLCTGDMEVSEEELINEGGTKLISKPYDLFEVIKIIEKGV